MCGRTACTLAPGEVSRASCYRNRCGQRLQPKWRDGDGDKYRPSYNKSPQSSSPVLLSQRHFDENAPVDECVLAAMRWGLVPFWFKENDPSKMQYRTSNCRSESILEKRTYKDPLLKGQRCVILADGFYEWKRQGKDIQPFFIYFPQTQIPSQQRLDIKGPPSGQNLELLSTSRNSPDLKEDSSALPEQGTIKPDEWSGWRLLTIAGLFDCWTPPEGGDPLYTYSVITVDACPNLKSIHDRMPAILDGEEEVRKWLDFGEVKSLEALKMLQPKNVLDHHPVASLVNNSRNNSPECMQPVELKEPKLTASSKMMMSWLKSSTPSKRKEQDARETQGKQRSGSEQSKTSGSLEQWLHSAHKKPRTN